jgi:hypothetical protein
MSRAVDSALLSNGVDLSFSKRLTHPAILLHTGNIGTHGGILSRWQTQQMMTTHRRWTTTHLAAATLRNVGGVTGSLNLALGGVRRWRVCFSLSS